MPPVRTAPDSADLGAFSAVLVSNDDSKGRVGVTLDFSRTTALDGRVVIPGVTWLAATTRRRSLAISDSSAGYWFDLPLQARPDSSDLAWSEWFPAPGQRASADVRGTNWFQVRWRVAGGGRRGRRDDARGEGQRAPHLALRSSRCRAPAPPPDFGGMLGEARSAPDRRSPSCAA